MNTLGQCYLLLTPCLPVVREQVGCCVLLRLTCSPGLTVGELQLSSSSSSPLPASPLASRLLSYAKVAARAEEKGQEKWEIVVGARSPARETYPIFDFLDAIHRAPVTRMFDAAKHHPHVTSSIYPTRPFKSQQQRWIFLPSEGDARGPRAPDKR